MELWKMKRLALVAVAAAAICTSAFADVPLAGDWHVEGDGFAGTARLPGTLAVAHLGKRWTERDFQTTMDLPQSEALVGWRDPFYGLKTGFKGMSPARRIAPGSRSAI